MKPNILLIVMDCVRPDHLSCYGYHRKTSPNIDKIAKEGILFKNAYSTSNWTLPAHASLFTGLYPSEHGCHDIDSFLDKKIITLIDRLKKEKYETLHASNNIFISAAFGLDKGFKKIFCPHQIIQDKIDIFRFLRFKYRNKRDIFNLLKFSYLYKEPLNLFYKSLLKIKEYDNGAKRINNKVKSFIKECKNNKKPFFIFINYLEAHHPYKLPNEYMHKYFKKRDYKKYKLIKNIPYDKLKNISTNKKFLFLKEIYDGAISYIDYRIGELYFFLKKINELDNTIFIILSDHGEAWNEHNHIGHIFNLYQETIKIPLIIRYFKLNKKLDIYKNKNIQLVNIIPTILDMLNFDLSPKISQRSLLKNKQDYVLSEVSIKRYKDSLKREKKENLLYKLNLNLKSFIYKNFKLIINLNGKKELYNLLEDPKEKHNLANKEKLKIKKLISKLKKIESTFNQPVPKKIKKDFFIKQRLKELGYL